MLYMRRCIMVLEVLITRLQQCQIQCLVNENQRHVDSNCAIIFAEACAIILSFRHIIQSNQAFNIVGFASLQNHFSNFIISHLHLVPCLLRYNIYIYILRFSLKDLVGLRGLHHYLEKILLGRFLLPSNFFSIFLVTSLYS